MLRRASRTEFNRLMRLKLTIRHYYDFGADRHVVGDDLVTPESWDGLRTSTSGLFAIPASRDQFVRGAEGREEIAMRARAIDAWLDAQGSQSVASYGVGGAVLEWWLHTLRPARKLTLTDYGEKTLDRLSTVFPEAEVRHHDLRRDAPLDADTHVFHRIDTELDDVEWRDVFARFANVRVLVVATEVLDVKRFLLELTIRPTLMLRRATSAGYLRTRAAFSALWNETHDARTVRMHDLNAWALTPKRTGHRAPSSR
jgi:hypothetical protein